MKTILLLIALTSLSAVAASKPYGMAGCGFGNVLMEKDGPQILAATTNELSTQTFAISSGTSNCVTVEERTVRIKNFIEFNYASLSTEMAQGQGDTVNSLAYMYGCREDLFAEKMRAHWGEVFTSNKNDATGVLINIKEVIKKTELRTQCAYGA